MIRRIAEAVQDWLQGKGREWATCSDCNGSGALVYVRWRDGRIEDFPGRRGVIDDEDIAEQWQRACPSCAGLGTYHYEEGRLIPGRGDEFDAPPPARPVRYADYIQSDAWRARAVIAKARAGQRCQDCRRVAPAVTLDAHHLTYERLGHERPEDIAVLCRECHARRHGRNGRS